MEDDLAVFQGNVDVVVLEKDSNYVSVLLTGHYVSKVERNVVYSAPMLIGAVNGFANRDTKLEVSGVI